MTRKLLSGAVSAAAAASMIVTPALARPASTLTDINGSPASSAQNQLEQRGFTSITSHRNSQGYVNSYWWHSGDKNCVNVEAYNGEVETVTDAQPSDCNQSSGNSDAAVAVGVIAGAAILGALLSSKSHHREGQNYDQNQTGEFDRGYTDGLHGAAYHNYNRADAYSSGYESGTDERNANLSHHHNRGGYAQVAQYGDLVGSRASGAMSELEQRGFRQVDNFTSGNSRYSIQWRSASHQCLQVIVDDGRIYNITDIQTHPKCR